MWRLLHKALATNSNLIKRNIPVHKGCYFCHRHREDESHLFRDCDIASRIWSSSNLGIQTCSSQIIPFGEWAKKFLQLFWKEEGVKSERAKEFVATLWSIWIHMNNIVFRDLYEDPTNILKRKDYLLRECIESNRIKDSYRNNIPSSTEAQQRIPNSLNNTGQQGICVMLVDGAWKRHRNKHPRAGIGWTAYVNEVKIFKGNSMIMASSALQAEAYAIHRGLYEAHSRGIRHLQIHSDSTEVVRACDGLYQAFEITTLILDIKAIRREFNYCEIKKVGRLDVTPAHRLAIAARQGKFVS